MKYGTIFLFNELWYYLRDNIQSRENMPALCLSPVQWITSFFGAVSYPAMRLTKVMTSAPTTTEHVIEIINKYRVSELELNLFFSDLYWNTYIFPHVLFLNNKIKNISCLIILGIIIFSASNSNDGAFYGYGYNQEWKGMRPYLLS